MQDFGAGTKVIINRDGDIWDGSEGTVLDPNTFGSPHISDWILVQGCVEDEFGLRTGERFYPADALEVVEILDPWACIDHPSGDCGGEVRYHVCPAGSEQLIARCQRHQERVVERHRARRQGAAV